MIRFVELKDTEAICNIYNYYVENTIITFEEEQVAIQEMEKRIVDISSNYPYFVYEEDDEILGYAYASTWKARSAYRYSVELSVYLNKDKKGFGIGKKLYTHLLDELKTRGIHRAMGCITLPNEKSVDLHEKLGFKKVAEFHEVGYKFDQWIDVGYWEYEL